MLPNKVQIGGQDVKVIKVTEPMCDNGDGSLQIGEWRGLTNEIVALECPDKVDTCFENFLHEAMEGIDDTFDLALSHQSITTIAAGMYQVLKSGNMLRDTWSDFKYAKAA